VSVGVKGGRFSGYLSGTSKHDKSRSCGHYNSMRLPLPCFPGGIIIYPMKIIGVNGSSRKGWNTHTLVEDSLKGAASKGAGR
jgi:hypothetical protein